MEELRAGMTVRDTGGEQLGKVVRIYPWGFEVVRGFWSPYQWVFLYGEVIRIADGAVEVTRGRDDLQRLAAGNLPVGWRREKAPFGDRTILSAPAESRAAGARRLPTGATLTGGQSGAGSGPAAGLTAGAPAGAGKDHPHR